MKKGFESSAPPQLNGRGGAEVFLSSQLAPILEKWINEHDALHERPSAFRKKSDPITALEYLSAHSGVQIRRIYAILRKEFLTVDLNIGDALLCAMERQDLFGTPELQVVPNPHWSQERWINYVRSRGSCI